MKQSLRDYVITLCLALVIFAVVAFFLIRAGEGLMGDVVHKIGSEKEEVTETLETPSTQESTPAGATPQPEKVPDTMATFLLMGLDHSEKNADAIFLVCINATQKQAQVVLIPSNTIVTEGAKHYKLGELYGTKSPNFYKEFVFQQTGVMPDYYGAMTMSGLANLIDFLGGIQYKVPQNMYYFDPTQNLKINLKAGTQTLTGDQAVQLVAFRGYPNGNATREETQIGFARVFCQSFLTPENLARAKSILYNVIYHVDTDFEEMDLNTLGEVIFNFTGYAQNFSRIPGSSTKDGYYNIGSSNAKAMLQIYQ